MPRIPHRPLLLQLVYVCNDNLRYVGSYDISPLQVSARETGRYTFCVSSLSSGDVSHLRHEGPSSQSCTFPELHPSLNFLGQHVPTTGFLRSSKIRLLCVSPPFPPLLPLGTPDKRQRPSLHHVRTPSMPVFSFNPDLGLNKRYVRLLLQRTLCDPSVSSKPPSSYGPRYDD